MAVGQKCIACHRIYDASAEDFGSCCSPACAQEQRLKECNGSGAPMDQLEAMIRDGRDVVIDFARHSGEFAVIARRRGETTTRTYTGFKLADAIHNCWEHEKP